MKKIVQGILKRCGVSITRVEKIADNADYYRRFFSKESVDARNFYNICFGGHFGFGGNFHHPLWTNIDVDRVYPAEWPQFDSRKDITFDPFIDREIPLADDSAELFHSRFSFEHIADQHARATLREIHRCLKPGGIFHVVVPNLELDYMAYIRGDPTYFSWVDNFSRPEMMSLMRYRIPMREMSLPQVFLTHFAANASPHHLDGCADPVSDGEFGDIMREFSFEKAMNLCTSRCSLEKQAIYRQNHVNWWSPSKMQSFLLDAGFSRCIPLTAGQSLSPVMRKNPHFDSLWNDVVLVMEAVK